MQSSLRVQVPDHPRGPIYTTVDGRNPALPLGTLSYGNYGICLIMGNAGFRSSAVPLSPLGFSVQGIQLRVYIYILPFMEFGPKDYPYYGLGDLLPVYHPILNPST